MLIVRLTHVTQLSRVPPRGRHVWRRYGLDGASVTPASLLAFWRAARDGGVPGLARSLAHDEGKVRHGVRLPSDTRRCFLGRGR